MVSRSRVEALAFRRGEIGHHQNVALALEHPGAKAHFSKGARVPRINAGASTQRVPHIPNDRMCGAPKIPTSSTPARVGHATSVMNASTDSNLTIRIATVADAEDIARLSGHLGYPTQGKRPSAPSEVNRYPATRSSLPRQMECGRLDSCFPRPSLTTGSSAEVAALVVDETLPRCGTREALMREVERWAKEQGYRTVTLRSNLRVSGACFLREARIRSH